MDKRERRRRKRKEDVLITRIVLSIIGALAVLCVAGYALFLILWKPVAATVQLEVGEEIKLEQFLSEEQKRAAFVTDVSVIDTSVLGEYEVVVKVWSREFTSKLCVVDTTAPTGEAVAVSTEAGTLPEAESCVTNIVDKTNVTVSYKEEPDVSTDGDVEAVLLLTDEGGNVTEVTAVLTVWSDKEPPVIEGVTSKVVTVGGTVSYKKGVTVTDNKDEDPTLEIDNSRVDLNTVGKYEVVYTATDKNGNSASVTTTVTVVEKKAESASVQIDEATVNELAKKVLNQITTSDMTDMEVAFAIYKWTRSNIGYVSTSDKSSWLIGAYQAFTKKSGDCFNYFSAAKAMFNVAGIDNIDIVKSDTSHSSHYWSLINIGTGWYHVDCTPRKGDGDLFFMVTDAELLAYSKAHNNSHIFDSDAYPERATESVQSQVKY